MNMRLLIFLVLMTIGSYGCVAGFVVGTLVRCGGLECKQPAASPATTAPDPAAECVKEEK